MNEKLTKQGVRDLSHFGPKKSKPRIVPLRPRCSHRNVDIHYDWLVCDDCGAALERLYIT